MESRSSLGDRAVVVAGILAVLVVVLFGAERAQPPGPIAGSEQSVRR